MADKSEEDSVQELITKSEDDFEKKILYIGAGALLLSLTLLDKIIQLEYSSGVFLLIIGWSCLIVSILINLSSHLISKAQLRKVQKELDDDIKIETRRINHKKRICIIESINWSSIGFLIIGISMIVLFASINSLHPQKNQIIKEQNKDTLRIQMINLNQSIMAPEEKKPENPDLLIEGRTPPNPVKKTETEKKGYTPPAPKEAAPEPKPVEPPTKPPDSKE